MNMSWTGAFDTFIEVDPFDPTDWLLADRHPREPVQLSLSDRIDCHTTLDWEDYLWAIGPNRNKPQRWCHTYGSGSMDPETGIIDRPNLIYARRSVHTGLLTKNGKPQSANLWLHRLICQRAYGQPEEAGMIADHINGDTLDNRRVNLRWATKVANARNLSGTEERSRLIFEQQFAEIYV